jgi:hypothetical protein
MKKTIRLTESELISLVKNIISENDSKILLRKLTKKSVLGDEAGIYRGWTVDKLLNNNPKKLYYIYTHYEKITFMDDILDELMEKGFPVEYIEKPGVDKGQYMDYLNQKTNTFLSNLESKTIEDLEKLIKARRINKVKIDRVVFDILNRKKLESLSADNPNKYIDHKSVLQAKNHGRL